MSRLGTVLPVRLLTSRHTVDIILRVLFSKPRDWTVYREVRVVPTQRVTAV